MARIMSPINISWSTALSMLTWKTKQKIKQFPSSPIKIQNWNGTSNFLKISQDGQNHKREGKSFPPGFSINQLKDDFHPNLFSPPVPESDVAV